MVVVGLLFKMSKEGLGVFDDVRFLEENCVVWVVIITGKTLLH